MSNSPVVLRPKESFDLNSVPRILPMFPDSQKCLLKFNEALMAHDANFYFAWPGSPTLRPLYPEKSLRYASHSERLGKVGKPLLQLSLAICLKLYPVSDAIRFHRAFAGKYLLDLPEGNFYVELTLPIAL